MLSKVGFEPITFGVIESSVATTQTTSPPVQPNPVNPVSWELQIRFILMNTFSAMMTVQTMY